MDAQTVEGSARHQPRLEDDPLVRGLGRYAADVPLPGQTQAYFVRSPHAFADIRSIDTAAAKAAPGVVGVLTAADMEGIGNVSQHPPLAGRGGQKLIVPHRPALAGTTVRHVGEPVAVVIAETLAAAQDAAELVTVEYEERTPAVDLREAVARGRSRKSGRRLPATSRSTGPARRRIPRPTRKRSSASSHPPRTWRALPWCIKGSWCNRWSRAERARATIRRTTATSCAAVRKARARCATGLLRSSAFPPSGCASSPKTSAAPSG